MFSKQEQWVQIDWVFSFGTFDSLLAGLVWSCHKLSVRYMQLSPNGPQTSLNQFNKADSRCYEINALIYILCTFGNTVFVCVGFYHFSTVHVIFHQENSNFYQLTQNITTDFPRIYLKRTCFVQKSDFQWGRSKFSSGN